ncbi:hypothetical protein [Prevotella falsenii]|uniref:hypothetical protein n=1 Tax=Prevotella falsenii TaxID=515414 RepID=UPI00046898B6|nr:hypothetical protein [Prevotella falsenii]
MNFKLSSCCVVAAFLAVATGCSNDDLPTKKGTTQNDDNTTETTQVTFVAGNEGTRTSLNYDSGDFYWEANDHIFVQDDNNQFQKSSNAVTGNNVSYFEFMMPGKYSKERYMVYYPGQNGTNNQVTISKEQTQSEPNSTKHFGVSGDCGTATATLESGQYKFKLDHAAAYLCFEPTYSSELASTYIEKIVVTSDNNIAGTGYTLGTDGKLTGTGEYKTITLTPQGTNGFKMEKKGNGCSAGRLFMVIAPGTHKLTVEYYLKDTKTTVNGVIKKTFSSFNYTANGYHDINSELKIRAYTDDYYMWDAQKEYWYGYKANQPTPINEETGSNYPKETTDARWFNTAKHPTPASNSAKNCPNYNECTWYCMKGDPHWDNKTLWTIWKHLYTGGMWFKKASVIAKENKKDNAEELKKKAYNGKDYVTTSIYETPPNNPNVKSGTPENRNNYFFLPALGYYADGKLNKFGSQGFYWTSTAISYTSGKAYNLYFDQGNVVASNLRERTDGFRLWTSE